MKKKKNKNNYYQKLAEKYFSKKKWWQKVINDEQFDRWFNWSVEKITELTFKKLSLDKNNIADRVRDPIAITGPVYWEITGVENGDIRWKKGKDNIVRFSVNHLTIFHFTNKALAAYECDFNFLKNKVVNEVTYQFHYQDIVSVTTSERNFNEKESFQMLNGKFIKRAHAFRIKVPNDEFGYLITSTEIKNETGGIIPTDAAEQAVIVIRKMLRDKKK